MAVIYLDLTQRVTQILKAQSGRKIAPRKWPKRFTTPQGRRLAELEPQAQCPACQVETEAEERYAARLAERVRDADFRERYVASRGVCLPHLRLVLQECGEAESRLFLATTARDKLSALLHDVQEYTRKHSWQNRHEPKLPEEQISPLRAVALQVGENR